MTAFTSAPSWLVETRALLRLAGPLVVNTLSIAGMQFADAVMAGQLGAEALAAVAVGAGVWLLGFTVCLGLMMAIAPIASRYYGAGELDMIGRYTRQGILLGVFIGIFFIAVVYLFVGPALVLFNIDSSFRDLTAGYVRAIVLGAPAICIFLALRFTSEGIGFTRPIMYTSLFGLVSNVFFNYVFMYGHLGAPAMGAVGCGLASAVTMWLMMFVMASWAVLHPRYRPLQIFARLSPVRLAVLQEIVVLGTPIAVTITAEVGLFAAVSILMGTRSAEITAAHQIAINFASTMFMVPMALSSAITIRIGHALGAGNAAAARFSGVTGISLCAVFMACSAAFLLVFRDGVVNLYTNDTAVQAIAINLLLMAAIFQIADGIQVGAAGALRGYKDMRVAMVVTTIAYWVLAFPLAWLAAITYQAPPEYIWAGFVLGLSVAAVLLALRFRSVANRALSFEPGQVAAIRPG